MLCDEHIRLDISTSATQFLTSLSDLTTLRTRHGVLSVHTYISRRTDNSDYCWPSYPSARLKVRRRDFICRPFLELNFRSGVLLHSTVSFNESRLNEVLKAGPVRCSAVDSRYTHLATAGDDKLLKVWAIDTLQLLNERCATPFSQNFLSRLNQTHRELPKKPTQIAFTRSGHTIVVSDKFGDVFRCVCRPTNPFFFFPYSLPRKLPTYSPANRPCVCAAHRSRRSRLT